MKKKLEAELISIAHRILQIKQKSDIVTLHHEVQKLYETLSVLRFIEDNFGEAKPTIGIEQVKQKIEDDYDKLNSADVVSSAQKDAIETSIEKVEDQITNDDISGVEGPIKLASDVEIEEVNETESKNQNELDAENPAEEIKDEEVESTKEIESEEANEEDEVEEQEEVSDAVEEADLEVELPIADESQESEIKNQDDEKSIFIPSFELAFDPKDEAEEPVPTVSTPQFTFDDLLGKDYSDPVFVKAEPVTPERVIEENHFASVKAVSESVYDNSVDKEKKTFSLNDRLSKGITIGLNDRIAFMKHLFGNSSEDYNRVLSQLMTFDTFDEAEMFINDMVKPDYNNWDGKDEYSQRFLEIVERRFS